VVFSADRVRKKVRTCRPFLAADAKVVKVDDYTVDFILTSPNPILHSRWDTWYIMDKKWAEANNCVDPTPAAATTPSFASLNANGTGAFTVESHQPGVKTVYKANPNWWRKPEHNLKEIIFTPNSARTPRASQPCCRARWTSSSRSRSRILRAWDSSPNAQVLKGPGNPHDLPRHGPGARRTALFERQGKNPFKDVRVREAFFKAVDIELIKNRVMRGLSTAIGTDDRAATLQALG